MPAGLFSEFAASDKKSWKKLVEKELKGKPLNPEYWKIADSVYVDPYYTAEEAHSPEIKEVQAAQRKSTGWLNSANIRFRTPSKTNLKMRSALGSGADAVVLDLNGFTIPACELTKTLHAIRLSDCFVYFATSENPDELYREISKGAGYYLKGGIASDPLAEWMRYGKEVDQSLNDIGLVLQKTKSMKDFRPYMIESHVYHDAGADPVQELAFMISAFVKCTDHLTDHGITALHAVNRFFFSVSISPDYLCEIAKLRALRYLFYKVTRAYQLPDELCKPFIHAKTSSLYQAHSLEHTNMIRATTEAMSAVSGGCDLLTVQTFDESDDSFADRIANNVSLLISNESGLSQVADPAAGSYLLDNMTLLLADAAWNLFLTMEDKGGIIDCFENGTIQRDIEKSWDEKLAGLRQSRIMVGVNKFNDPENSKPKDKTPETDEKKTITRGLPKRNLSDAWFSVNT
jgi:methylmalonyl-CoA mutase